MRSDVQHTGSLVRHLLAASALGGALALATPVAAQTSFEWPDTTVRLSTYTTVEQCLSAAQRVNRAVEREQALVVWRDTLPRNLKEKRLGPAPAEVSETARRCAERFTEPGSDIADFAPLLRLYLDAGRDEDAAVLVRRRLAAVPAKGAQSERTAVVDSAVDIYLAAHPARIDAAENVLLTRAQDRADRIDRIAIYNDLMTAASSVGDTARERRAAGWIVSLANSLTKAERESAKFEELGAGAGGKMVVLGAIRVLTGFSTMLDSLRRGTAALTALERNMWAAMTKGRPESIPIPVGEKAPEITADYWFPSEAASTPRPAPGRVSIVQFLDHDSCVLSNLLGDVSENCGFQISTLRRLSERFPDVEVTIVSRTRGSFLYSPPPSTAEEANLVREWLAQYRIPGAVIAVASTPFWNLPRPDSRRIDKPVPVIERYGFAKSFEPEGHLFLVDQDGLIVTAVGFDETQLGEFIEVLLQRQSRGGENAVR
ncbi:MAG TPA: hypothetical protein VFT57_00180 [Gemmatimonadaceae bacterium]|nr:hypothetical protein [Gemmatimonadaceae bacterium]